MMPYERDLKSCMVKRACLDTSKTQLQCFFVVHPAFLGLSNILHQPKNILKYFEIPSPLKPRKTQGEARLEFRMLLDFPPAQGASFLGCASST